MKKNLKNMLLTFILMMAMISCNNEELFVEPITAVPETDQTQETVDPEGEIIDASTPCDFALANVQPNSTLTINCVLDLQGKTITLPSNVTVDYQGGEIINGTLNFSDNSVIDGNLLNPSLSITGSTPQTKSSDFEFVPKRWGIVEGKVSDAVALRNRDILVSIMFKAQEFGITTFFIDKMDAYFQVRSQRDNGLYNVGAPEMDSNAISIPSNFHLAMGDDTHLRVQPNDTPKYALISLYSVDNAKVSGGNLWGDRYAHNYISGTGSFDSHDWGHVVKITGAQNSEINGVKIKEGSGDGISIGGTQQRNNDGSLKPNTRESYNLTVKNCIIDDCRRNNISIADGTNLFIEYNTIINAGSGNSERGVSSNGTSPRSGIDIEGFKWNAPDNNSVYEWQKTENIHIRHNVFEDNYAVDVALYNGEKAYVYENTFRSKRAIGISYSYNSKIYNNSFERKGTIGGTIAIDLPSRYWANGVNRIKDFEIYNNTFSGYKIGISAGGQGNKIKDNTITDCEKAIILIDSEDLEFDNNTISSNLNNSGGYGTWDTEITIKNCLIKNGETNVQVRGLTLGRMNNIKSGDITIDNVDFNGDIRLLSAQNVTIKNSTFEDITIEDCNPILVNNN